MSSKTSVAEGEYGLTLKELLQRVLKESGLSQRDFLEVASSEGLKRATVSDWVSGRVPRDPSSLKKVLLSLGVPGLVVETAIMNSRMEKRVVALIPNRDRRKQYTPQVIELVRDLQRRLQYTSTLPDGLRLSIREIRGAVSDWPLLRAAMDGSWPMAEGKQFKALVTVLSACAMHIKVAIDGALDGSTRRELQPEDYERLERTLVRQCIGSTDPGYRGAPAASTIDALQALDLATADSSQEELEIAGSTIGYANYLAQKRKSGNSFWKK